MLISTASPEYNKLYARYHRKHDYRYKKRIHVMKYKTPGSLAVAMSSMRKKLGVKVLPGWAMQALLKQIDDLDSSPS